MKKILVTLLVAAPIVIVAQVKPSIPKADKALREGKYDEAKTIIDATTGNQDFMVDKKKGTPTKNAAKAWFLRGMIYCAIDTTKKQQFKSLSNDPFAEAKDAFEKAKQLEPDAISFFNTPQGFPELVENTKKNFGAGYFNQAVEAYNDQNDYKKALLMAEKTMYFMPGDTLLLFYSSAFAQAAEEEAKSILYLEQYLTSGGKDPKAYATMANIYLQKKDNAKAAKWVTDGLAKYPAYRDLRLMQLNIFIEEKQYDKARVMVEAEVEANPTDPFNYYQLGQLCDRLGERQKAKEAFQKSFDLDPKSVDTAKELAEQYWQEAKVIRDEMGALGNSKADMEKRKHLDPKYVELVKLCVPRYEAVEKLAPDDVDNLYKMLNVYQDLGDEPKAARVKKRLKTLGEDVH